MAEQTRGGSPSEGVPPDRTLNHGSPWVRCEGRSIITEGSGGQPTHRAYYRDVVTAAAAGGGPPPPTISPPPEGVRAVIRHVHGAHQRVFEASWKEAGGDVPPETWKEYFARKASNISMAKEVAFEFEAASGPIGIQFGHSFPRIEAITSGSQADGHPELCAGMELLQIAGFLVLYAFSGSEVFD